MNKYQGIMTITSKKELIKDVYEMILEGDGAQFITTPGQFINIKLNDSLQPYLRRPMSICDYDDHHIKIIFRVVGTGTKILADKHIGDSLDCLTGLGNGFTQTNYKDVVVIGGGLGVPPMYALVKHLLKQNVNVNVILGFNDQSSIFYQKEFATLAPTFMATMDGSVGTKGTVIDVLKHHAFDMDAYYACGPIKMLEALAVNYPDNGYLSYEARMGCGFGACMGCSCKVKSQSYKRICMEGPVLLSSEVIVNG